MWNMMAWTFREGGQIHSVVSGKPPETPKHLFRARLNAVLEPLTPEPPAALGLAFGSPAQNLGPMNLHTPRWAFYPSK